MGRCGCTCDGMVVILSPNTHMTVPRYRVLMGEGRLTAEKRGGDGEREISRYI